MSSTAPVDLSPGDTADPVPSLDGSRRAGRGDKAFRLLTLSSGLLVLLILGLIAVSTTQQAWPAFSHMGVSFFTSTKWNPTANGGEGEFGALALIYGTLLTSAIGLIIAVPISLGIALFTTELAGKRLRGAVGMVMDLLAAIPSVVYGLWAVLVFIPFIGPVYGDFASGVESWPVVGTVFGPPARGSSFFTAGLILAIMVTPIITSLSREVIATVPNAQREAALALGATRWEMIRGSVLPWSRGGITGAVMLGLGRAMGETIAVALVVGGSVQITSHVFDSGNTMAGIIANQFNEATGNFKAALIGLGVVLFGITIIVNMAAQGIINRMEKHA